MSCFELRRIYLKYRLDGALFDLRRLNARTKTLEKLIFEVLFANGVQGS